MTATSRAADRAVVVGRVGGEQRLDVGGEVGGDERPQVVHRDGAGAAHPERVAGHHPQPERVVARRAGQPVLLAVRPRPAARRCPRGRVRHRPARGAAVAPAARRCGSWCRGRAAASAPVAGPEVGDDVAAAEGVDRLLGVADQHQRDLAGEGPLDDLPLHRVGVLELVDHARSTSGGASGRGPGRRRPRAPPRAGTAGRRSRGCRAAACAARARGPRRRRRRGGRRRSVSAGGSTGVSRVRGLRDHVVGELERLGPGQGRACPSRRRTAGGRGRRRSRRPGRRGSRPG